MRQLLGRYTVHWINTIGTRRPRFDWATLRRGLEKLRDWLVEASGASESPGELRPANLRVTNPAMWPSFGSAFARAVNRKLLVRQLKSLLEDLGRPAVAVTTLPIVADLIGMLPVTRWVYYCVDDFSVWPGLDGPTLARMEAELVDRVDTIIAVSEPLQAKLARPGRPVHLLTHGIDLDFWRGPDDADPSAAGGRGRSRAGRIGAAGASPARGLSSLEPVAELSGLERPLVVFWGVKDRRMDVAFVRRLADDLPRGTIVLVGPENDPDPLLYQPARVVAVPSLPFAALPHVAREAAVLIMPYADLPVTRAMQPLKLKEYLATGRPAVVRDLPATRPWVDCLDRADTPEAFARLVRLRIETGLPAEQRAARERLANETWAIKARVFERWLLGLEPTASACPLDPDATARMPA